MMNKILMTLVSILLANNALAYTSDKTFNEEIKLLPPKEIFIERPYQNLFYTQLEQKTVEEDAQAYLEGGLRYYYGSIKRLDVQTIKDYTAASKWFYEAGIRNNAIAGYYLGNMYLNGQGVKPDYKSAIWWFSKSSKNGLDSSTFMLGSTFYRMSQDPRVSVSYKEYYLNQARAYYKILADKNNPRAFFNRAAIILKHEDLTRFNKKDASSYLTQAVKGFILDNDKANSYEALKLMAYYKMSDYDYALELFNSYFKDK